MSVPYGIYKSIPTKPSAPNISDSLGSIDATAKSAINTELQYMPQYREQNVQDILSYAGAAAQATRESAFPLALQERALYEQMEPETFAVNRKLAEVTLAQLTGQMDPTQEASFRERFRSEEALGGRLGSPVGSASIATKLAQLNAEVQNNAANRALNFLNRTTLSTPDLPMTRGTDVGSMVSPYLQSQSSIFGTQGNMYNTRVQDRGATQRQWISTLGNLSGQAAEAAIAMA